MVNLTKQIHNHIVSGENVLVAGKPDGGKTYFVEHELIHFLSKAGLSVGYFKNIDEFILNYKNEHFDVFVFDEFETFFDRDFLIKKYDDFQYYSEGYIQMVANWHKTLATVKKPSIFILTRNEEDEIDNMVTRMKQLDWGDGVICFKFTR